MWIPDPDTVQHWSLPMELVGLFLTMVEIYRPRHSLFLEDRVDRLGDKILSLSLYDALDSSATLRLRAAKWTARMIGVWSFFVIAFLVIWVPLSWRFGWTKEGGPWRATALGLLGSLLFQIAQRVVGSKAMNTRAMRLLSRITRFPFDVLLILFALTVRLLGLVVRWFNAIGRGRAIGGIGVALSGIGLLGEVYQVLMMDDDDTTRFQYWSAVAVLIALMMMVLLIVSRRLRRPSEGPKSNMNPATPWDLPVDVVHPGTKHVVGRVYRDGLFIAFDRSGSPYYELTAEGTVMNTVHDRYLRLTSEFPSHGMEAWGHLLDKAIFDECLCGNTEWSKEDPHFTRMRLPCDSIMEYMSISPMAENYSEDGSMTTTAKSFKRFQFALPQLHAKGWVEFTYDWSSRTFVEQKFKAQASLVIEYQKPVSLSMVKEHEERLRSFFDFIWFRGHRSGFFYLHDGESMAMLHRRESLCPEVHAANCLNLRNILTAENLPEWIERWFSLPKPIRMALNPVISLARNPGIITDMKMVMSMHALDALLKVTKRTKGGANEARFFHGLGEWWQMKRDIAGEPLFDYIKRIVETRDVILKASQHELQSGKPLLTFSERPRAYFEMLLLHRALFIDLMGVERARIDAFVETGFGKTAAQQFRYFSD